MPGISIEKRVNAFCRLGDIITDSCSSDRKADSTSKLPDLINTIQRSNKWFSPESVRKSLLSIASWLNARELSEWLSPYSLPDSKSQSKKIGIVMAGNIPLVGFHDFLCVLITGNYLKAKVSSKDNILIKEIARILVNIEPEFEAYINLYDNLPPDIDAVIATGSDNSARYFEYNFGRLNHIFRKNRNSVAIVSNSTSDKDLQSFGIEFYRDKYF